MLVSPSATIPQAWRALEVLAALSYRSGELRDYLGEVARGVSELLGVDWSVVTLCRDGYDRVLASSIDIGEAADRAYALHGTVTGTVADTGQALVVEDSDATPELGTVPAGYHAYLGVPLRALDGRIIGTICSFHRRPRNLDSAKCLQMSQIFCAR